MIKMDEISKAVEPMEDLAEFGEEARSFSYPELDEAEVEVEEKFTEPGADTPESIRQFRERMGLSRRDVEIGTELSSSVVWRAEQVGRKVTDEERTKIWDFLINFECDYPKGKVGTSKNPRPTKIQALDTDAKQKLAEAEKARDEWMKATWDLRHVIDEVTHMAAKALDEAKAKKRSTTDLKAIVEALAPHTTKD